MATVQTAAGAFAVPDDVAHDYTAEPAPDATPDETWTMTQLRARARTVGVTYKGLRKPDLLEALR